MARESKFNIPGAQKYKKRWRAIKGEGDWKGKPKDES